MQHTVTPLDLYWVLGEQDLGPLEFYFAKALIKNGKNVNYININTLYSGNWKKLSIYSHRFPRKYDNSVQRKYLATVNDELIKKYKEDKPSFVFIYNDCKVLPETVEYFKKCGAKIINFLGDDPNYLFSGKKTFLLTVMHADIVIVPDTGWIRGLRLLGVKNIIYSPVGTDTEVFFKTEPSRGHIKKFGADILFVGTGYYLNSWGIKRASVLNELCGMNFKLFGDGQWNEVLPYFPGLMTNFIPETLSAENVNIACSCAKLYPVVVNAGVVNGVSTRVFDCIASEIFVLSEYKKDTDRLFPGGEIVSYHSKRELKDKAEYFLKNENEMRDHTEKALAILKQKYTLDILVKDILEQI
ncbi:MAG: glycosyltransferase [Ignavibacteria bacterium]